MTFSVEKFGFEKDFGNSSEFTSGAWFAERLALVRRSVKLKKKPLERYNITVTSRLAYHEPISERLGSEAAIYSYYAGAVPLIRLRYIAR